MKKERGRKSRTRKITALSLAVVVAAGALAWTGMPDLGNAKADPEETTETQEAIESAYPELLDSSSGEGTTSKDETVYIVTDPEGNTLESTVAEWLRNGDGSKEITDVSTLNDIENTSNDKTFKKDGDTLVWSADGRDIKYKGTADGKLPVDVRITYYLDGSKTSAKEIAGKSGDVTIRFDYDIDSTVSEGGYDFVTPYTMASGLLLDDGHFTNIRVSNGKVIDDGNKCICLGIAFPGLEDDLDIHSTEFEIPDHVEITAYTDCFEIDGTYTAALTGLLSDLDIDTGSVSSKVEELTSAMDKLADASDKLVAGAGQLSDGAYELSMGAGKVSDGASKVSEAAGQLSGGLSTISKNSDDLDSGAGEVFNSLLSTAKTQLEAAGLSPGTLTISNYQSRLSGIISSLDKDKVYQQALKNVTAQVEKKRSTVEAGVTEKVKGLVTDNVTAEVRAGVTQTVTENVKAEVRGSVIQEATGKSAKQYDEAVAAGEIDEETQEGISKTIETKMTSEEIKQQIESAVETQMASDDIKQKIASIVKSQMASSEVKTQIKNATESKIQELINENMESEAVQAQLAKAEEGAQSVIALKTSLDKYNAFYLGVLAYTSGVDQAASGASKLASGASDLNDGASSLAGGASKLYGGAKTLYDGMDSFDKNGIDKLISSLDEAGVEEMLDRLEALEKASDNASLVGGIADGMSGESKMIIKSEAVKSDR